MSLQFSTMILTIYGRKDQNVGSAIDKWNIDTDAQLSILGRRLHFRQMVLARPGPGKLQYFWENTPKAAGPMNYPSLMCFPCFRIQTGATETLTLLAHYPSQRGLTLARCAQGLVNLSSGRTKMAPTQIVEFEGIKVRAPRELSTYLHWATGDD